MKDFYYILGTANNATPIEIDEAYNKLARKFYPTEGEQDDFLEDRLREITEAYDILRDTRRRRAYDAAFRRSQKKQLAAFRVKYLNIGVTIMFLAITALFADYVLRTLHGHPAKKAATPPPMVQPVVPVVTHIKKHHHADVTANKKPATIAAKPDTTAKRTIAPVVAVVPKKKNTDSVNLVVIHANITGIVYLHQSPDYNSPVIAKIPDGGQVRVMHKGTGWYKVGFNDQTGYVIRASIEGD